MRDVVVHLQLGEREFRVVPGPGETFTVMERVVKAEWVPVTDPQIEDALIGTAAIMRGERG